MRYGQPFCSITGTDAGLAMQFLEHQSVLDLEYLHDGIQLVVLTGIKSIISIEIPYHKIFKFIGFYDDFDQEKTLYFPFDNP